LGSFGIDGTSCCPSIPISFGVSSFDGVAFGTYGLLECFLASAAFPKTS